MEKPPKRRTSISPSAAALASAAATAYSCSSSASTNPAETASPSPYFLPELLASERRQCGLMFVKGTLYGMVCPYFRLAVVELHDNMVEFSFLGDESSRDTVPKSSRFWLAECRGELLPVVDLPADHPLFSPMFTGGSPGRGSGLELLALVVVACSSVGVSSQVALAQIIREFEGTACTLLPGVGGGGSTLWLMNLCVNTLPTTQGEWKWRITDHWLGSFQALADAVQWVSEQSRCS